MALGELKNGIGPDAYAIYQQVLAAVVERDHPVGSLYISENATSPAELYGGTWERIEGKFIMGASDAYPAGSTGGSATHTQTEDEIASHAHFVTAFRNIDWNLWSNSNLGEAHSSKYTFEFSTTSNLNGRSNERGFVGTDYTGNGKPMDILNPYYSMYIWRRVA